MRNHHFSKHACLVLLAAACTFGTVSYAQSTTQGAISGTVFDATNAVIPNATVVIRNNSTNAEMALHSDASGFFKAPELAPGTYTVTITAPGFQQVRSSEVTVQVNGTTQFDQHLTAGSETATIEVTAVTPVLDFDSPTYGGHLSNTEIESIPINNRRWSTLALLTPGATVDTNGFGLINFRAISPLLNNVEIDGADDNQALFSEERGRTRAGYSTAQSMIREFQVNSGVYSAEYGRAVGGVINSVTKQGGNAFHGEAYFYNRKSSRAAFQPGSRITTYNAATSSYVTTPFKPSDNRNQFGFEISGPILQDRLFFAYAFDMFRRNFPGVGSPNNPSSFFAAPSASTVSLLASRLGTTTANASTLYNNQLQALLADLGSVPRFGNQEINTPKLDLQVTPKEHVSVLYHRLRWDSPGGVQTQGVVPYSVDAFGTDFVKLDYGLAKLDSELTSHLTNELRYQYGRELNDEGRQNPSSYTNTNFNNATGSPTYVNLAGGTGTTCSTNIGFCLGAPYYSFRTAYPDERKWQIGDTANFLVGNHSIRFGEDVVHNYDVENNVFEGNGLFQYSTIVNYFSDLLGGGKGTCDAGGSSTGSLPCYTTLYQGFGQPIQSVITTDYALFVQDDWRIRPRLTLNLGLRYDYESLPAPFAPNSAVPQTTVTPSDKNNIAPRIGLAWDPFGLGKTTVHAGYGVYYGRIYNAALLTALQNSGAGVTASPSTSTSQASYQFTPTTAGAPRFPQIATAPPPAGLIGPSLQYLDAHLQNPYTHQFDLAVQHEIGKNTVVSVSYIGALGRELPNFLNLDLNPASTYTINYTVAPGSNGSCGPAACGTVFPVKVYASKRQTGPATTNNDYSPLLNPKYNGITAVVSNLNSSYHGLTVEVERRAGKYFSFDANYTWSHAMDFNQSTNTSFNVGGNNWFDPYGNARANYGNSLLNVPHRVVAWAIINGPTTHGDNILSYVINGWSLKPIVQSQTGLPYSVLVSGTTPNQCNGGPSGTFAGCLQAAGSGLAGTSVTYIPALGRNTRHYPNVALFDARIQKDFTFAERYTLQLMGEGFNLWNHENVTGVTTTGYNIVNSIGTTPGTTTSQLVFNPSFGTVTTANTNYASGPRQIQISARVVF